MTLVERTEEQEAVGDDGYRRIRTDIVFGRLRPGQKSGNFPPLQLPCRR